MLGLYYPTDDEVSGDAELQRWIQDISTRGFLGNRRSGMCSGPIYIKATFIKSFCQFQIAALLFHLPIIFLS
jgi:hypothetical protein